MKDYLRDLIIKTKNLWSARSREERVQVVLGVIVVFSFVMAVWSTCNPRPPTEEEVRNHRIKMLRLEIRELELQVQVERLRAFEEQ